MRAVLVSALLLLAGCTLTSHQSYDGALTYRVTEWAPDDPQQYKTTHWLLIRVPHDEPAPIKPADTEFLPRDQAPAGTAVGDLLTCSVHQERNSLSQPAADAAETFGPCHPAPG